MAQLKSALPTWLLCRLALQQLTLQRRLAANTLLQDGLVVAQSYRRLGVGSLLLQGLRDYAVRQGYQQVRLDLERSNRTALALYLQHGYRLQQPNIWQRYRACHTMIRTLC